MAVDFMGRSVKAGDTVVYPVRRGSSMWLNKLRVTQVDESGVQPKLVGFNPAGRRVQVQSLDNVVVVEPLPVAEAAAA